MQIGPVSKAHVQGGDVVRRVVLLLSRSDELLHRGEPMADLVLMEEVKRGLLRPRRRERAREAKRARHCRGGGGRAGPG